MRRFDLPGTYAPGTDSNSEIVVFAPVFESSELYDIFSISSLLERLSLETVKLLINSMLIFLNYI